MKLTTVAPFLSVWTGILLCLAGCQTAPVTQSGQMIMGSVPSLAVPRTDTPPVIDGSLSDDVWSNAVVIPALFPASKAKGAQLAVLPTTVRVLWDAQYLYVGFECEGSDIFCSGTMRHDDLLYKEDVCEVFIDGVGDGRQFIELQVNPDDTNLDLMYVFTKEADYTSDMRLTPVLCERDRWKFLEWEMTGLRTAGKRILRDGKVAGWSVEMAIPAESIMRRKGSALFFPAQIRANFIRYAHPLSAKTGQRGLLQMNWSPVLLGNPHNSPARMGQVNLIDSPKGK